MWRVRRVMIYISFATKFTLRESKKKNGGVLIESKTMDVDKMGETL